MFHAIALTLLLTTNFVSSDGAKLREMKKEAIAQRQESTASADAKRDQFQTSLSEIKDERKRLIVQNVALRFTNVKDKWVRNWEKTLGRLTTILEKVETEYGESDATTAAAAAISDAQTLVDALEAKTYDLEFSEESTIKTDMQSLVSEFKSDLKTTKESVKNAKEKVQEAFRLAKGETENEEE